GGQTPLPVDVETSTGDVAQVERRRSAPPDAARALEGDRDEAGVVPGALAPVGGEPGRRQGVPQLRDARDADRTAVQLRARSALRAERLAAQGIVDQPEDDIARLLERDADGTVRVAVREVGGAVERADVPAILAARGHGRGLLGQDGVIREGAAQRVHDQQLGLAIGHRDDVGCRLECDRVTAPEPSPDQRSGAGDGSAGNPLEPPHGRALACASTPGNFSRPVLTSRGPETTLRPFPKGRSRADDRALGGSQAGKAPDCGSGSEGSTPSRPTRGDGGAARSVKDEIKLFTGNSNRPLAEAISRDVGVPLGGAEIGRFSDGEVQVEITENVRGGDVFVIQSISAPTNDNLMELLLMLDAFKRASAKRITAVIPYYGYARQDRQVAPRVPISAKLLADLITTAGASRVLTVDLHAGQIQGFFNVPVDNVYATPVLLQYLRERLGDSEVTVIAPDAGGVERA